MRSEQVNEIASALSKAQAKMESAAMNKVNPAFKREGSTGTKYADLASVIAAFREPLAANGLAITQTTEIREGGFVLVTTLIHSSGQWLASEYPLPAAATPQAMGSALTYARRYSLSCLVCNAADEDDDANGAQANGQTNSTPKAKPSPVKPQAVKPPADPETGEIGPHEIKAPDVMAWGAAYVAAIKAASSVSEIEAWQAKNKSALDMLPEKIADRVAANVNEKLATFGAMIAAE